MKNVFRLSGVILLILSILLIHSCKKDKPTPPIITTTAATEISYTTATSGGDVTNEGGAPVTAMGVCWNTSADPTIANSKTIESIGSGTFTSNITQLTPNTMYYIRAYATNGAGTGYGNQVSFTTTQIAVPILITTAIISISQTTAVSGGNITVDNGGSVTARGVCWSISANPTIANGKTIESGVLGAFISNITQLAPNTLYYVRAYATNSAGTGYGNQISFITSPTMPTLTTVIASSISTTSCKIGGNISSDGGAPVTVRGVCWSTTQNPTIANSITSDGSGIGSFTSSISGLIAGTTYYVKAYATNNVGTGYGNAISFTTQSPIVFNPNITYGKVTDIDGNIYKTITIGTQIWMAENLKTTHYNNTLYYPIPNVRNSSTVSGSYWWYNNDIANKDTYGALYNWYAVGTGNLCPTGWHVPSVAEWTTLVNYLGGWVIVDGKLKEAGTSHWISPNVDATNSSGFTALPGGFREYVGGYYNTGESFGWIGYHALFWTSTEGGGGSGYDDGRRAHRFELRNNAWFNAYDWWYSTDKNLFEEKLDLGYSVRCVKDF